MYRNNCFCKIKKELEKLQKQINQNYSGDSNLNNIVGNIRRELDQNFEKDAELTERVDNIQASNQIGFADNDDIDTLFP